MNTRKNLMKRGWKIRSKCTRYKIGQKQGFYQYLSENQRMILIDDDFGQLICKKNDFCSEKKSSHLTDKHHQSAYNNFDLNENRLNSLY